MTRARARLLATLRGQQTDRIPLFTQMRELFREDAAYMRRRVRQVIGEAGPSRRCR